MSARTSARRFRRLAATAFFVSAASLAGGGCIRPPTPPAVDIADADRKPPPGYYTPSSGEHSHNESKGGLKLLIDKQAHLPLRPSGFKQDVRGDKQTLRYPPWLLFHSRGHKGSLSFEAEWSKNAQNTDDAYASATVAFHDNWTPVDASEAKYLVLWVKAAEPDVDSGLRLVLRSVAKKAGEGGRLETGPVSIKEFAHNKKIGSDWTKIVIPLKAFPEIDKVDTKQIQTLRFDLDGLPPRDKKVSFRLDNIFFTDADLITPVTNVGYLVRSDGVLLIWDKKETDGVKAFEIQIASKTAASVDASKRQALVPLKSFGGAKQDVSILTVGEEEKSTPVKVKVNPKGDKEETAAVRVEATASHKVSPFIFGSTFARPKVIKELKIPVNRWGGPRTSKYNWEYDVDSAGNTDFFLNGASKRRATKETDKGYYNWIKKTLDAGSHANFTIPIGPWIAKGHPDEGDQYCSFPKDKFPKQANWHPEVDDCGDGVMPDGKTLIWGNDPNWSMVQNSPEHQKKLVEHIKKAFGGADKKGVRFYSLDNEPGLWFEVHRDTVPKGISAEELVALSRSYATMIKSVDPAAQVIGFNAWGPVELAGSNVDYMPAGAEGYKKYGEVTPAQQWRERKKHNNRSQLVYYLDEMKLAGQKAGKRLIDVVSVHWFPPTFSNELDDDDRPIMLPDNHPFDAQLADEQFEAVREWYDPTYVNAASYTADANNKPYLWDPFHPVLPALKKIIAEHYPGTKLGINAYETGSRDFYHGALIRAAVLGIFMQEDVYMAHQFYQDQDGKTFVYLMQKLYNNYDDKGGAIRGDFYKSNPGHKDLFSFVTNADKRWHIMLVNKSRKARLRTTIELPKPVAKVKNYLFSESLNFRLLPTADRPNKGQKISVYVPAYSAVLIVAE